MPRKTKSDVHKSQAEAVSHVVRSRKSRATSPDSPHRDCRLSAMMADLSLTLRAVGQSCGMSPSGVLRATRGGNIWLSHAQKIAKFFGVTVEEIWPSTSEKIKDDCDKKSGSRRKKALQ